jgi:hypothetical protein
MSMETVIKETLNSFSSTLRNNIRNVSAGSQTIQNREPNSPVLNVLPSAPLSHKSATTVPAKRKVTSELLGPPTKQPRRGYDLINYSI